MGIEQFLYGVGARVAWNAYRSYRRHKHPFDEYMAASHVVQMHEHSIVNQRYERDKVVKSLKLGELVKELHGLEEDLRFPEKDHPFHIRLSTRARMLLNLQLAVLDKPQLKLDGIHEYFTKRDPISDTSVRIYAIKQDDILFTTLQNREEISKIESHVLSRINLKDDFNKSVTSVRERFELEGTLEYAPTFSDAIRGELFHRRIEGRMCPTYNHVGNTEGRRASSEVPEYFYGPPLPPFQYQTPSPAHSLQP